MTVQLRQETLLAIIAVQQEIVETHPTLNEVMNVVTNAAARLTGADAAVVELQEGDEMVYRAAAGTAQPFLGLRLSVANSLSGLCVRMDRALRCDDCEEDPRVDREACRKVNARSMLVTPLRYRGTPMGVLKVYSARVRAFSDESAEMLRMLVGIIAASMHRAREHEGLSRRAMRDGLTDLANRRALEMVIQEKISVDEAFAIGFLDLNGFKKINDERGHKCGDRLLQIIAHRIASSVRDCDVAARVGGDEFVVLFDGIHSRPAAMDSLTQLVTCISEPVSDGDATLHISAEAGLAMFPEDGDTMQTLLEVADSRMYSAKKRKVSDAS